MTSRHLTALVPALLALAVTAAACETRKAEAACARAAPECLKGVTFQDTYHEVYPPEVLAGKVVVVNFWATWCKPCKKEIPAFNRVYTRYQDRDVLMFGVLTEDIANTDLLNFASDHEMTYPIVRIDSDLASALGGVPANIPTTYIYDRSGKRVVNHLGVLDEDELARILDSLLAAP
jgi:thiol-disulfide isomerase/thioredoxin